MKSLKIIITLLAVASLSSCDYFYSLDIENQYSKSIYIGSTETGLKTGHDHMSLDELYNFTVINIRKKMVFFSVYEEELIENLSQKLMS